MVLQQPWRPPWLRHPPHRWQAGTLDRAALVATAQALAGRPDFLEVAQRFARCWLAAQQADPALRAVFRNTPRYLMLVASLVLHHERDRNDPLSGITPARMRSLFAQGHTGPAAAGDSQVKAMLAHARLNGLLEAGPAPDDRRYQPLVPTLRLQHIFQQWVGAFLQAMHDQAAWPLPAAGSDIVAVPGLVPEVFSYRLQALRADRFVLIEPMAAELRWVLQHDHGYRVFLHAVEQLQGQPDGSALVAISASTLAARAGVARGTVRNLLHDAEQQGWFAPAGQAPALRRWSAPQVNAALLWIALELEWMHGLTCAAWGRRGDYSA